jgi:3-deoxy-D-manno-octulosonate 8-phosphate phosphatase (KDO 8-P phosphatase)
MAFFKEELKKIKAFVFDVDGVLSLQAMPLDDDGELIRTSCTKDGYSIMYAGKKGYKFAIISGGGTIGVQKRYERLGIKDIHLKIGNKVEALKEFMAKYEIDANEILYMGDDIPDYEVMRIVGLPVCPNDAVEEIKSISAYVSEYNGGEGCVRDVIEQVLKARGDWMDTSCFVKSM